MDNIHPLKVAENVDMIAGLIASGLEARSGFDGADKLLSAATIAEKTGLPLSSEILRTFSELRLEKNNAAFCQADEAFFARTIAAEMQKEGIAGPLFEIETSNIKQVTGCRAMQLKMLRNLGPIPAGTGVSVNISSDMTFSAQFNSVDEFTLNEMHCVEDRAAALERLSAIKIRDGRILSDVIALRGICSTKQIDHLIMNAVETAIIDAFDEGDIEFYMKNWALIEQLKWTSDALLSTDVLAAARLYADLRPAAEERIGADEADHDAILLLADAIVRGSK